MFYILCEYLKIEIKIKLNGIKLFDHSAMSVTGFKIERNEIIIIIIRYIVVSCRFWEIIKEKVKPENNISHIISPLSFYFSDISFLYI